MSHPANIAEAVLTAARMRAEENRLIAAGATGYELMRQAGTGAAEWIWRVAAGRSVTVLCGPGNNGGDGYVIAETLRRRGCDVSVVAPVSPQTQAASQARAAYQGPFDSEGRGGVLVDCLFGTGLSRPIAHGLAETLHILRQKHDFSVAFDLPSGVDADTGALMDDLPQYDLTLALGAWKRAHWLMPAMAIMGERRLVPIGLDASDADATLSERPKLAAPPANAHKYSRGLVAVVGGEMPGAALLACEAAMQAGAGYVKLLADPPPHTPPDLVVQAGELPPLLQDDRIGAVLVGPGLGRAAEAAEKLTAVLASGHPLVLDADALALLKPHHIERRTAPLILTPHAGEMATLCEAFSIEQAGKVEQAQALAHATSAVVLAKGPDNILAHGNRLRFFPPASSWLSIAGTGDVLAGIVASRLAVCGDPFQAAEEAVWLHALAAKSRGPAPTALQIARSVSAAYEGLL